MEFKIYIYKIGGTVGHQRNGAGFRIVNVGAHILKSNVFWFH